MPKFSQAVRYIIYTLWLIDTFKDINPAWPVLSLTLILKKKKKAVIMSCPAKVTQCQMYISMPKPLGNIPQKKSKRRFEDILYENNS